MKTNDELLKNDPELKDILRNFAYDDAMQYGSRVDARTTSLVMLASCIAQQAKTEYKVMLEMAWKNGVTPVEIKEVLYHTVPYAGMAKVMDFVETTNKFLDAKGVSLPLKGQSTTTPDTRFEKGLETQTGIFGKTIATMRKNAPRNQAHIQDYLSANCFGDYYTRKGLSVKDREVITYAILISQGGCEPQVKGHIQGNLNVGNDKAYLLEVTTRLLPLIGYPRTLNAIACLNAVVPEDAAENAPAQAQPESIFPLGNENTAYAQYFSGKSWLAPLTSQNELNVPMSNVTFEPGCRNNWHSHTGGQILIAITGKGYYQEKGQPARLLLPGDIVEIAPNVIHWHGAAPDSWFSHIAISCNPQSNENTWLDAVSDEEYNEATSQH